MNLPGAKLDLDEMEKGIKNEGFDDGLGHRLIYSPNFIFLYENEKKRQLRGKGGRNGWKE
jgi:hypothetical protein